MHIITPTEVITILFVPRVEVAIAVVQIIDESENKDISSDITHSYGSYLNGFTNLSLVFKADSFPVEGRFYIFNAYANNGQTLCYRGRLFCTSQTDFEKYTVNEGQYVKENSYNNEFIVL
tara:strand:- start:401 stop:760 length:360 start_codon:yes stop_codon:yes gene_type:complete